MTFTFQDPGVKNVRVTVADADGDTDSTMKPITVGSAPPPPDSTAPDTTIGSGPNGATNDSTPTFAFTASESGSTFQCRVDSGSWATCTSPWTTTALSDGSHGVSVRAKDAAGNTDASPATRSVTVDTQPPGTMIDSAPPALSPGSSATVTFSSPDSGATFQCRLDDGAWAACTSPKTYTGLTLGGHTAGVRAADPAGNVDASPAGASWTSIALPGAPASAPATSGGPDSANQAPTVTLLAPSAGATFTSTLAMAATASDDHGVRRVEFWVDGTRVARDTTAPYAAAYTAGRSMSYGVHTVTVRAFDAAGVARSAAVTVTRVRATAPTRRTTATSSKRRARAAQASSDDRQNMLVAVSMWRIASAPADGAGTLLRGRGMPGRSATVSLTRCDNAAGAIAAVVSLTAAADGTLYARQAADGLCVLRVRPFGDS
jgi:Big-like domain-containing protein